MLPWLPLGSASFSPRPPVPGLGPSPTHRGGLRRAAGSKPTCPSGSLSVVSAIFSSSAAVSSSWPLTGRLCPTGALSPILLLRLHFFPVLIHRNGDEDAGFNYP